VLVRELTVGRSFVVLERLNPEQDERKREDVRGEWRRRGTAAPGRVKG